MFSCLEVQSRVAAHAAAAAAARNPAQHMHARSTHVHLTFCGPIRSCFDQLSTAVLSMRAREALPSLCMLLCCVNSHTPGVVLVQQPRLIAAIMHCTCNCSCTLAQYTLVAIHAWVAKLPKQNHVRPLDRTIAAANCSSSSSSNSIRCHALRPGAPRRWLGWHVLRVAPSDTGITTPPSCFDPRQTNCCSHPRPTAHWGLSDEAGRKGGSWSPSTAVAGSQLLTAECLERCFWPRCRTEGVIK